MIKLRFLVGVAVVLGALMTAATPALAEFQSLPTKAQTTSGKSTVPKAGEFVAKNTKGEVAGKITCLASHVVAQWSIRSPGQWFEEITGPGQRATKRGPHLQFTINWEATKGDCSTEVAGLKLPTTVEPCILQLHQKALEFNNVKGDVITACVIKVPSVGCLITIPTAEETKGENFQLSKIDLSNVGEKQNDKITVTGITQKVNPTKTCPLESNKSAELTNVEIEAEGENVV